MGEIYIAHTNPNCLPVPPNLLLIPVASMNKRITLKLVKNKTKQAISFLHLTSSYSFIRVTLGAVVCHAVYPFSPISPTHEKCIAMSAQTSVISMVCYGYQEERNINTNPDYCRTMDTEMSLRCSPGLNITMELYGTADHSNLYGLHDLHISNWHQRGAQRT